MTHLPHPSDADALRARLRADLLTARKSRQSETVAALRSTLAAIDNAEATEATGTPVVASSEHFAGAQAGLGATEARRRVLSPAELHAIVQAQIQERQLEADNYQTIGQPEAAARLRREAEALTGYLDA